MNIVNIHFLAPTIIAFSFAIITLVYFYRIEKKSYQFYLLLMFGCHITTLIFQGINSFFPNLVNVYIYTLFQLFLASFALTSAFSFIGKAPDLKYYMHVFAGIFFLFLSYIFKLKIIYAVIVAYSLAGISLIISGYFFSKSSKEFFEKLFSIFIILWGVHKLDYPFLVSYEIGQLIGYFLSSLISLLMVFSIIASLFEEGRRETIEKSKLIEFILENIPDIISRVVVKEGTVSIVWISPNIKRILGYNAKEIMKHGFVERVVDNKVLKKIREVFTDIVSSHFYMILPVKDAEGNLRYFDLKAVEVSEEKNQAISYDIVLTEITRYKFLEEEIARLEGVLLHSNIGFIFINKDGTIVYANKFINHVLSSDSERIIGKKIAQLWKEDEAHKIALIYEKCKLADPFSKNIDLKIGDKIFRCYLIPINDEEGRFSGELLLFKDATELVKLEEIVERRNLIEEISKNIAVIVHDFKNLLSSSIAGLSFLQERLKLEEDESKIMEGSLKSLYMLNSLANELLEVSSPKNLKIQETSIDRIIELSKSVLTPDEKNRLDISIETGLKSFLTDEKFVSRSVGNILRNAFDVTPPNEFVNMTIKTLEMPGRNRLMVEGGKYLVLSITDCGPGMTENALKNIFKPFYSEKKRGLGLGLYIAYSLIKAIGGAIDVKSEPGKGTTFYIYIPLISKQSETHRISYC